MTMSACVVVPSARVTRDSESKLARTSPRSIWLRNDGDSPLASARDARDMPRCLRRERRARPVSR